jgi:hypothetical protein
MIEGVDRLGKSTLINNIINECGYHLVIHYEKPKLLPAYKTYHDPLKAYQKRSFETMFDLVKSKAPIIFDRAHLGEVVYSPLYRKYSAEYVYDYELYQSTNHVRLVLLTTSDFSICTDDGLSFNFDNKETEQKLFIDAFNRSNIKNKVIIDVCDGNGNFKHPMSILEEVLNLDNIS